MMRALFNNPIQTERGLILVPGQYVPIHVVVGRRPCALTVPQQAVLNIQAGTHVLMVGEGDKVVSRPIDIVASYQHRFVISSGLKEGDKIIVEGLRRAKDGRTVKPVMTSSETRKKQPAASGWPRRRTHDWGSLPAGTLRNGFSAEMPEIQQGKGSTRAAETCSPSIEVAIAEPTLAIHPHRLRGSQAVTVSGAVEC